MRTIFSPFDSRPVGEVPISNLADAHAALASSSASFARTRKLPAFTRHEILQKIAAALSTRRETLAAGITDESGKTIRDSRTEVDRAALVFSLAADEARRQTGETIPLDINAASVGRVGLTRRTPLGVVAALTPFNFPLNLVAHKVAPAMAIGAPIVLKPAEKTPLTALRLREIAVECGWPPDAFSVLTPETPQEIGALLATDPRAPVFSFTGSAAVGWELKSLANKKRVTLELGGNAGVFVAADADLDFAATRCATGSFANAGQVCISVQRIFVEKPVFDVFVGKLIDATRKLVVGDPREETTDIGPMISSTAADRVESAVESAIASGARALLRGERTPGTSLLSPTILTNVDPALSVCRDEIFGPVVVVESVATAEDALAAIDNSVFGLQAGIFTNDLRTISRAWDSLNVGALIVGDIPQYRADNMPYGGERESGFGREGIRYAIEEMTALRLAVMPLG